MFLCQSITTLVTVQPGGYTVTMMHTQSQNFTQYIAMTHYLSNRNRLELQ